MSADKSPPRINRYRVTSLLIHLSVLLAIAALVRQMSKTRIAVSPGRTAQHLILSMPGSIASGSASPKSAAKLRTSATPHSAPKPSLPGPLGLSARSGEGASGQSAWGSGQITIAYAKYFPYPTPDLSTMPTGTEGDVVLTALIDEQGKIDDLTLLAGIGPAIDHEVIQTVSQWTFTPATKDGVPISSKQEIHFHFRSPRNG